MVSKYILSLSTTCKSTTTGLSQTGKQTLDDIRSRQQSNVGDGADGGPEAWEDVDDENIPMDDDIILSAEGGEMDILRECSGV